MEVEATVSITIASQTIIMTMDEAKELKVKLDKVVPLDQGGNRFINLEGTLKDQDPDIISSSDKVNKND